MAALGLRDFEDSLTKLGARSECILCPGVLAREPAKAHRWQRNIMCTVRAQLVLCRGRHPPNCVNHPATIPPDLKLQTLGGAKLVAGTHHGLAARSSESKGDNCQQAKLKAASWTNRASSEPGSLDADGKNLLLRHVYWA